jgi:hypothetical protein
MKKLPIFIISSTVAFFTSCGSDSALDQHSTIDGNHSEPLHKSVDSNDGNELFKKLQKSQIQKNNLDYEDFFNDGELVEAVDIDGATDVISEASTPTTLVDVSSDNVDYQSLEAETALQNLEESALEHQKSVEELRKINLSKDQTISTLSSLNDELISEIKRLKGEFRSTPSIENIDSVSSIGSIKDEVSKLKNNLALKSRELESLRIRNDSLEGKLVELESTPNLLSLNSSPPNITRARSTNYNFNFKRNDSDQSYLNLDQASLQFEAVVTSLNGKSKEAFYTEFFILKNNLEDILRKGGVNIQEFSGVDTYSELWARARKNSFLFPDVQKNIRALLLNLVEKGQGRRVRTDVDGAAKLSGLIKGKYFIIGTASLGKVGVTWSVPVVLKNGNNKMSLTLANSSWSL